MTKVTRTWLIVLSAAVALVIALLIVVVVQNGNAAREAKVQACEDRYSSVYEQMLCIEQID